MRIANYSDMPAMNVSQPSPENCHYERPGFGREGSAFRGGGKKQIPRCARDDKRYKMSLC